MASQDLRDLRAKITVLSDAVLDTIAQAEGCDRSEIVRRVLHKWAVAKAASIPLAAECLRKRLAVEGITGEG